MAEKPAHAASRRVGVTAATVTSAPTFAPTPKRATAQTDAEASARQAAATAPTQTPNAATQPDPRRSHTPTAPQAKVTTLKAAAQSPVLQPEKVAAQEPSATDNSSAVPTREDIATFRSATKAAPEDASAVATTPERASQATEAAVPTRAAPHGVSTARPSSTQVVVLEPHQKPTTAALAPFARPTVTAATTLIPSDARCERATVATRRTTAPDS